VHPERFTFHAARMRMTQVTPEALAAMNDQAVGRHDPAQLPELAARFDVTRADAVVLSACVQMPSLAASP
jgi:maleate cis-trans isomerase